MKCGEINITITTKKFDNSLQKGGEIGVALNSQFKHLTIVHYSALADKIDKTIL